MNDQDEQPPTTVSANGDETEIGLPADETELVPPLTAAASELAWSRDQENYAGADYSLGSTAERASIIVIAAAAVALVIGFLTWLGFHLYGQTKPSATPGTTRPVAIETAAALPRITAATTAPAAAPPPPSTVTVTASPPTTVTVEAAPPAPRHNDSLVPPAAGTTVFTICPDGHEGVVGDHTSCAFAQNVRRTFYSSGMATTFTAYSPVTGDAYEMTCAGRYPAYFDDGSTKISTRCYGGDNAEVVVW